MAGLALLRVFSLQDLDRFVPCIELAQLLQEIAEAFCGRLVDTHLAHATYFDPNLHWSKPVISRRELSCFIECIYLGNTKSREMNVFAEANPARCHWRWASCSMACLSPGWRSNCELASRMRWYWFCSAFSLFGSWSHPSCMTATSVTPWWSPAAHGDTTRCHNLLLAVAGVFSRHQNQVTCGPPDCITVCHPTLYAVVFTGKCSC